MKTIKDFMSENYDYVSYRLTLRTWQDEFLKDRDMILEHSTFAGCFEIQDGVIKPLDGDTYSEDEEVIWSETWTNEEEGIENGLTVLVPAEWISG